MAWDMNHVSLIGRLTRDPDMKYTPAGTPVTNFSIAVNRTSTKDGQKRDEVSFFNLVAWSKTAEIVNQHLKKGSQVAIGGRLSQRRWEQQDGTKRSAVEIVVNEVQFLGSPGGNSEEDQDPREG